VIRSIPMANLGQIARRIIHTCRLLCIRAGAVFADVDAKS